MAYYGHDGVEYISNDTNEKLDLKLRKEPTGMTELMWKTFLDSISLCKFGIFIDECINEKIKQIYNIAKYIAMYRDSRYLETMISKGVLDIFDYNINYTTNNISVYPMNLNIIFRIACIYKNVNVAEFLIGEFQTKILKEEVLNDLNQSIKYSDIGIGYVTNKRKRS